MDSLPTDVFILILERCSPNTLLSLRQVCSSFKVVVDLELPKIASYSVQRHYSCHAPRIFLNCELARFNTPAKWLRYIIYTYLATVLAECFRLSQLETSRLYMLHSISNPASHAIGDELRERLANGWNVLARLSDLVKTVGWHRNLRQRIISKSGFFQSILPRPIRNVVRRASCDGGLTCKDAADLVLLFQMCRSAFVFVRPDNKGQVNICNHEFGGIHDSPDCLKHSYFKPPDDSWRILLLSDWWFLQWHILLSGPGPFIHQWDANPSSESRSYFVNKLRKAVARLDYNTAELHRKQARELQLLLKQKAVDPETKHLKQLLDYCIESWPTQQNMKEIEFTIQLP